MLTLREHPRVFFVVPCYVFYVLSYDVRYDIHINTVFRSSLPPVVYRRAHVIFTLYVFLFAHSDVHHILCWAFIVFYFFRHMYPVLPVSLDCPFL